MKIQTTSDCKTNYCITIFLNKRNSRGVTPGNSWWGCAARFFKSWPDFSPKNVIIHTCFQTRPLKSIRYIIRLGRKHKNYSNPFRICIFLFLSYSFGIETIKMFIHSRSSLENHTRFQTKIAKVYTRFQTKMAQKPYPMEGGGTYLYNLYNGVPPPPRAESNEIWFVPFRKNNLCLL